SSILHKFLLKLDSSGNILWNQQLEWEILQLEIDLDNNIYVIGDQYPKFYLCKYNSSGSKLWSLELPKIDYISSMKFDSLGNIILKCIIMKDQNTKLCFMKYNNSGSFINKLEVVTIRYYEFNLDFWFINDYAYIFINDPDSSSSFLLKYNSTFDLCWNVSLNEYYVTPYYYSLNTVTVIGIDSQDNILFLYNNPRGEYTTEVSKRKYDSEDISVLRLNSSGKVLAHYYWGGSYHDEPIQIGIDSQDNIYLLCICTYLNKWNVPRDPLILVKNPEINGIPPQLEWIYKYDYYVFSLMGVMSVVSLLLLISIIRPRRGYKRKIKI
ncbi:MAG: hypothetical protein ACFFDF_25880, partial [Candidatus Odinarchaeota archaeon]